MKGLALGTVLLSLLLQANACGTTYQEAIEQKTNQTVSSNSTEYNASAANNNSIGDTPEYFSDFGNGYFTVLVSWESYGTHYAIIYANDTRVKYFIFAGRYAAGITPLYNTDGSVQVQDEDPPLDMN